jgi:amidase
MDREGLVFAGVARQAELLRRGKVSSIELVEVYLERIERLELELNAFRLVMAERALADAGQADALRAAGEERPLLGVPVAVKDTEDVAGEPTRWGTAIQAVPAERDNDLVSRLRGAGAVIIGKTNLPELAIMGSTEGPAFGVTRNPWDTDRTPGGSSGGSAAAVAAGLCAAATATDGAGSIRIPASCCGLVGLKPQRDRVSLGALAGHWLGMSVAGFVTRTVEDTALLLDVAADRKPERPYVQASRDEPEGLRIALSLEAAFPPAHVHRNVRASMERLAEELRDLGHEVTERDPAYGRAMDAAVVRYLGGIAEDSERFPQQECLQRRTRGFVRLGRLIPRPLVERAIRHEARHAARVNELFRSHDVLLTPTTARPPVKAAQWEGLGALRTLLEMAAVYPFTGIWNMTGQPAISIPAPLASDGLPIGAQLIAPRDGEGRRACAGGAAGARARLAGAPAAGRLVLGGLRPQPRQHGTLEVVRRRVHQERVRAPPKHAHGITAPADHAEAGALVRAARLLVEVEGLEHHVL